MGYSVSFSGLPQEMFHYAVILKAGITSADIGKALSFDGTNPNQACLSVANQAVDGVLVAVENRVQEGVLVGTIAIGGGYTMTTDGTTVNVGDQIQGGATAGLIKTLTPTLESAAAAQGIAATVQQARNRVMEKPSATTAVVLFF